MKKALYIIYIPLLLIEWAASMLVELVKVVHNSIEVLTLATEKYINVVTSEAPGEPEPKQGK